MNTRKITGRVVGIHPRSTPPDALILLLTDDLPRTGELHKATIDGDLITDLEWNWSLGSGLLPTVPAIGDTIEQVITVTTN